MRLIESFIFQTVSADRSHYDRSSPFSTTNALRTLLRSQRSGGPDDMNTLSISVLFSRGNHRTTLTEQRRAGYLAPMPWRWLLSGLTRQSLLVSLLIELIRIQAFYFCRKHLTPKSRTTAACTARRPRQRGEEGCSLDVHVCALGFAPARASKF